MLANNEQINWLPEHIKRRPVWQFSGNERRLGPFARALLGHAAADLGLRDEARQYRKRSRSYAELLAKREAFDGTEVWDEAKRKNPELVDDLKVHKPYIDAITLRLAQNCARGARCPRARSDRLLVRLRRDAVCPMGLSASGKESDSASSFPPISSARRSIKPAAGSTASWRSARCCSASACRPRQPGQIRVLRQKARATVAQT